MTADRRRTRWDEHRRSRRAELVDATIAAIRRYGAGVGMDEVAAQAGTSKAVVYRYFADRGELYLAVCTRVANALTAQLRDAMDRARDPREMLAAGVDAYLQLIEGDPEVYRFVVHRPLDRPVEADPVADLSALIGEHVTGIIAAQLRRNGGDPAAAAPWGHGLVGLVRSAADDWLNRPGMSRDELRRYLTDLAWAGLAGVLPTRAVGRAASARRTSAQRTSAQRTTARRTSA